MTEPLRRAPFQVFRTRRLSDLGDRSEDGGRARADFRDFEEHSGPT